MTRCTVCNHAQLHEIEERLHRGDPHTRIARAFDLTRHAIDRHAQQHLGPSVLAPVAEPDAVRELRDLQARLVSLEGTLSAALEQAARSGRTSGIVSAAREIRLLIVDLARLRGELDNAQPAVVNILQLPQMQELLAEMLRALRDYPEARLRLAQVIQQPSLTAAREEAS